ncbi:MAG: DUF2240 family protein [Candidatus Heimdallarchaeota archaeon]|nr:DUF2240 family protein [Candidatus Heimdallarchaeota archaeon]
MSNQRSLKEIVDIISSEAGLGKEEINQLINNKMDELGEFVTALGAAHIVAREMGVDLSSEPKVAVPPMISVDQLVPEITNVNLLGRITRVYDQFTFKKKDGSDGVLQSIILEDKTGTIRVVFWDQKAAEFQNGNCSAGDPIRILGAYTRKGKDGSTEVHLGIRSHLQIRPSGIDDENLPKSKTSFSKISDMKGNEVDVSIKGKVTQIDDILEFERSDGSKGTKRGLIVGDETGEVLVNFWNEKSTQVENLKLGAVITVVGLSSKIGLKGLIELHSNRFTNFTKEETAADFMVKKGLVGTMQKEGIKIAKLNEISDINQLISVKGLIINVNTVHEFSRESGNKGKVQNITISDDSGLMRVVLWDDKTTLIGSNDTDKMLSIVNGNTRKGRFTDIEIHCGNQTQADLDEVDMDIIKQYQVAFANLADITPEASDVNIRGAITELNPVQEITTKENETIKLQSFKINDQTAEIKITCWRDNIHKLADLSAGERIEIYQAKVKEDTGYGHELTITGNSFLKKAIHNDMTPQGFVPSSTISNLGSQIMSIDDIEDIKEDETVTIQATVVKLIEKQFVYPLCPECKKKVQVQDKLYICKDHGEIEKPTNKILFSFIVNDGTGNINILCAGKLAEMLIGMSADAVSRMVVEQESEKAPYSILRNKGFENSELIINGKVNKNQYLKSLEIIAKSIEEVRYKDASKNLVKQIFTE